MIRFEEPEIKVVRFATPDVMTLSYLDSYEGARDDKVVSSSAWGVEDVDLNFKL